MNAPRWSPWRVLLVCIGLGSLASASPMLAVILVLFQERKLEALPFILLALYAIPGAVSGLMVGIVIVSLFNLCAKRKDEPS